MEDLEGLTESGIPDLTLPAPGWSTHELSRVLAPEEDSLRPAESPLRAGRLSRTEVQGEPSGFTLKDAHAHEWVELASFRRPGFTIVVYRAGPGYLVRRKYDHGDLLHLRVCGNRVEVCRYLLERMNVPFFAKFVWGFLAKVA